MKFSHRLSKSFRKRYIKLFPTQPLTAPGHDADPEKVAQEILGLLETQKPCMIARFGMFELDATINYLGVKRRNVISYLRGIGEPWWWDKSTLHYMYYNAGFFTKDIHDFEKFAQLMLEDSTHVDILASWLPKERHLESQLKNTYKIGFELINPFWSKKPWSSCLKGKKVLVVHPFAQTIEKQYARRSLIHKNPEILPDFELKTIQAVQSIGGVHPEEFKDWFCALEYMKNEIDKTDYDICIIGCGAYGFPLAAHVKRAGKQAIHMGGSTQLLFGIKGLRWEESYGEFMNEYWVRPSTEETPTYAMKVEEGCYW